MREISRTQLRIIHSSLPPKVRFVGLYLALVDEECGGLFGYNSSVPHLTAQTGWTKESIRYCLRELLKADMIRAVHDRGITYILSPIPPKKRFMDDNAEATPEVTQ